MSQLNIDVVSMYHAAILIIGVYAFGFSLSNILYLHRKTLPAAITSGPLVSVLIPARNEKEHIGRCLRSLRGQLYDNYEILVLDDNSEDSS
jgi:chlorobactene glucosyltransferase